MLSRTYVAIYLCRRDTQAVQEFLIRQGIPTVAIRRELHITVYVSDYVYPGIRSSDESINVAADVAETRFMVMAAGGEVARPGLVPSENRAGLRFTRRNQLSKFVDDIRLRFASMETPEILGSRRQTTARRSAFGAPNYQPHMTLLNPGSKITSDLTMIGTQFRTQFESLEFDRLETRLWHGHSDADE